MKHPLLKVFMAVSIVALLSLTAACKDAVLQVGDVVSDPGAFSKPLTLEGVVYTHAKGDKTIAGVMDKKELQCTTPNCNKALLAIQTPGRQLSVGDEIKVSGTIVKESWGYILKADDVKVVTTHKIGA